MVDGVGVVIVVVEMCEKNVVLVWVCDCFEKCVCVLVGEMVVMVVDVLFE